MKINHVLQARKEYTCDHCDEAIRAGESYIWWKPINSFCTRWHITHGYPPRSVTTYSKKQAVVFQEQEILREFVENNVSDQTLFQKEALEEFLGLIPDALATCETIASEYSQSGNNMQSKFGTNTSVLICYHKADSIVEWMGELTDLHERASKLLKDIECMRQKEAEESLQAFRKCALRVIGKLDIT